MSTHPQNISNRRAIHHRSVPTVQVLKYFFFITEGLIYPLIKQHQGNDDLLLQMKPILR